MEIPIAVLSCVIPAGLSPESISAWQPRRMRFSQELTKALRRGPIRTNFGPAQAIALTIRRWEERRFPLVDALLLDWFSVMAVFLLNRISPRAKTPPLLQ